MSQERRKSKRREILENFSFYIQLPKFGPNRHRVNNISETGIGFKVETIGGNFSLHQDEITDLHLYLNQSLYLPLKIQVTRQESENDDQLVGAVFMETKTDQYQTYLTLVKFLDQLGNFAQETKK